MMRIRTEARSKGMCDVNQKANAFMKTVNEKMGNELVNRENCILSQVIDKTQMIRTSTEHV